MARLLVSVALAALAAVGVAQQDFVSNSTGFSGTWTSGSGGVLTGPTFADPMNNAAPFHYPNTTGIAYSFTDDGYFEEAQYRFLGNSSKPQCATAVVIWQHGKYYFHTNGSITMDPAPFVADGRVQVQDPCAATTKVLAYYSQFELFSSWAITVDINHAAYVMQLKRFDGSLFPRLYLALRPPTMLPNAYLSAAANGSTAAAALAGANITTSSPARLLL